MPWNPKDATQFTKKAKSAKKKRRFSHVANSMLAAGKSEGSAIRAANAAVAGTAKRHERPKVTRSDAPRR